MEAPGEDFGGGNVAPVHSPGRDAAQPAGGVAAGEGSAPPRANPLAPVIFVSAGPMNMSLNPVRASEYYYPPLRCYVREERHLRAMGFFYSESGVLNPPQEYYWGRRGLGYPAEEGLEDEMDRRVAHDEEGLAADVVGEEEEEEEEEDRDTDDDGSQQHRSESGTISQEITRPAIGGPFELFNVDNQLVTDADLRGSWTLMYFGYTSSRDVGPEEVQKMAKAIHILESEHNLKVRPIFITIDPQRDSPDQLQAYLKEFDPRIEGLTGSVAAIGHAAQEYHVYFKKVGEEGQDYLIESSNNMYLLDPNARVVKIFGVEYDELRLSDAIAKEVKQASK